MRQNLQLAKLEVENRLRQCFQDIPMKAELPCKFASNLWDNAVEVAPGSENQLLTAKYRGAKSYNVLHLDEKISPFVVVYYQPRKAAQLMLAALSGIAGATNPLLVGLAVLSAFFAIADVRTVPQTSECLLFSILQIANEQNVERNEAMRLFRESAEAAGVGPNEFETALQTLVKLGVVREIEGSLGIADKVILR